MTRALSHVSGLPVFAICCFMLACLAPVMGADGFTVPGTTLRLPDKLAGFTRGETQNYAPDNSATGVAIPYQSETAQATLFIRPLDPKENLKTADDLITDTFAAVAEMQQRGIYSEVKKFKGSEPEGTPWRSGAFIAKSEGTFVTSYIHCRVSDGRSVKIRLTSPDVKDTERHMKFIQELRALVDAALKSD
jgi:hypothetical protein